MIDLKELRVRLECHFDMVCYDKGEDIPPLGCTLLDAIDLVRILEGGNHRTVEEAVRAWQTRYEQKSPTTTIKEPPWKPKQSLS